MSSRALVFAPLISVLTAAFALTACQQAAWKAGASADDFNRDEKICRTQANDAATIQQCLRDKGWTIADLSAPVDAAPEEPINVSIEKPAVAPLRAPVSQQSGAQNSASQPAVAATKAAETKIESASVSTPATKPAPDPLQKQSVQTWWKAGAQSADFHVDADACLKQLGEEHTPNYAKHLYTRALVNCLQGRGWYAGANAVYTPLR